MAKIPPEDKARDEILRRMLNTPHTPHAPKAKPKAAKKRTPKSRGKGK